MTTSRSTLHVVLIAHYAPWLLNFRAPLLHSFKQVGARVTVLVPELTPMLRGELLARGVDAYSYPLRRTGLNPQEDLKTLLALTELLKFLEPTHVLTTAIKPNIWGTLAARLAGVPQSFALVTGLGYAFTGKSRQQRVVGAVVSILYRIAFRSISRVIFQNPDDCSELRRRRLLRPEQAAIIAGSGVNLAHYMPQPLPTTPPLRLLMVARLISEKGVYEYVQAAQQMRQRGWPVVCALAGPVDENPTALSKPELEQLIETGAVNYLGELDDVRPALADCHVFVLPSYREGTPRSTLEALATGRAVITTNAPGCRETVQHSVNGFLVPVGDAAGIVTAVAKFLTVPSLLPQMAEQSLLLAQRKYDVNIVNQNILEIMGIE